MSRFFYTRRIPDVLLPLFCNKPDWPLLLLALVPGVALASTSNGEAPQASYERRQSGQQLAAGPLAGSLSKQIAFDEIVLLEVRLDGIVLTEAITAYHEGEEIQLPLGELARLLTLPISVQPDQGTATGHVISAERPFSLQAEQGKVMLGSEIVEFDPALVRVESDDIYVSSSLLSRWLPLDFTLNLPALVLQVHAREQLPIQARLEREQKAKALGSSSPEDTPDYARHPMPYRLLGVPFIDQTLGGNVRSGPGGTHSTAGYTAYLTGDLLGMESALYISSTKDEPSPDARFTLARHDPHAALLGPLRARSVMLGSAVSGQTVTNVAGRSAVGNGFGVAVSNRPFNAPTNFDRHTLRGDLPPGWDVELYFNGALVGLQLANAEGKYSFDELPLHYGLNEFRLVFHGPLGQTRVEKQSFYLEEASMPPGTLYYNLTYHQDDQRQQRTIGQFEWGMNKYLTGTAGFSLLPPLGSSSGNEQQLYTNLGLRAFWGGYAFNTELVRSPDGGLLNEFGVKTRLGDFAVGMSRTVLNNFTSEVFLPSSDPLEIRDKVRIDGAFSPAYLPRLPLTLELQREQFQSGRSSLGLIGRISAYVRQTSISNQLTVRSSEGDVTANGALQLSRRFGRVGLSGQLGYSLKPEGELQTLILSADRHFSGGYLANLGVARTLGSGDTLYSASLNKNLGRYGFGVNSSYASDGTVSVGMQLFVGMGRDPRQEKWHFDARLKADSGVASVRVFEDLNANGMMDAGEPPIKDVAINVNGSRTSQRTDAQGVVWVDNLPVRQDVDIEVDIGTLEDPYWVPKVKGLTLTPRPGHVAQIDFPVLITSEVDGTVYLRDNHVRRGIGGVEVELVDADSNQVIKTIKTSSDGFYIVPAVIPGRYYVRISPRQLAQEGLADPGVKMVDVEPDGDIVSGLDFELVRSEASASEPSQGTSDE